MKAKDRYRLRFCDANGKLVKRIYAKGMAEADRKVSKGMKGKGIAFCHVDTFVGWTEAWTCGSSDLLLQVGGIRYV